MERKESLSIYIPTVVREKMETMLKRWRIKNLSKLVSDIFYRASPYDPLLAGSLVKNVTIRRIIDAINRLVQDEIKKYEQRQANIIFAEELVVCPHRRKYNTIHPHLLIQQLVDPMHITMYVIKNGLKPFATFIGGTYSYLAQKQVKVGDKVWIVEALIDLKAPGVVWLVKDRAGESVDSRSLLLAWLYKCLVNAKQVFIFCLINNYLIEVEVTPDLVNPVAESLGISLDPEEFIHSLVEIHVNKSKVPLWPNECNTCPYRCICTEMPK